MRRYRIRRRRAFALALVPATMISMGLSQGSPAADDQEATVNAPASVRIGDATVVKGEFPGAGNAEVAILSRPAGEDAFRRVATSQTGTGGRWAERVKPRRTGDWRARLVSPPAGDPLATEPAVDSESDTERIRVRSLTKVKPAKRDVVAGNEVEIHGRVLPAGQREVIVEVGGDRKRVRADRTGRFDVDFRPSSAGSYSVRAIAKKNKEAGGSKDSGGKLTAYRYANAS